MARRHVVWMVLLLPLLLTPAVFAEAPPVSTQAPQIAESGPEVPGADTEVQWLTGFLCHCYHDDPCGSGGVFDSTTCQEGETCGCSFSFTDYVDGYSCYHGAYAYCT